MSMNNAMLLPQVAVLLVGSKTRKRLLELDARQIIEVRKFTLPGIIGFRNRHIGKRSRQIHPIPGGLIMLR